MSIAPLDPAPCIRRRSGLPNGPVTVA